MPDDRPASGRSQPSVEDELMGLREYQRKRDF